MVGSSAVAAGPRAGLIRWVGRLGLGRKLAFALTIAAIISGTLTYAALSGSLPVWTDPRSIQVLLYIDLALLLLLAVVVARRLVGVWMERRRGSTGSRLHARLVVLFSLVALAPTLIVSGFSMVFFNLGVQAWFSEPVRTALQGSNVVAEAYLNEHRQAIRGDVLAMARDLSRAAPLLSDSRAQFRQLVRSQSMLRSLTETQVFDGAGRMLAQWNLSFVLDQDPVPYWAVERARSGEVVLLTSKGEDRIRAIVKLENFVDTFLYVGRYVDPLALSFIERMRRAVVQYESLEDKRSSFEVTFAMMFALVALVLLMAAIWVGLSFANGLARPIMALVAAAERVRAGDLGARVEESADNDEIATLGRTFNRMTDQIEAQRDELIEASRQIDARRHFIETVLAGVSAGIIGLDARGWISLSNRSAQNLLGVDLDRRIGERLDQVVPEMGALLARAGRRPERQLEDEVVVTRDGRRATLLVRIAVDRAKGRIQGFVVTFDDVSELLSAQRKAAWADIARRIAHEIKNPLTPIQLSAERLMRKYSREIASDPENFVACTETIIRQVGEIGRMVDEFSSFARMPAPTMRPENLAEICEQAVFLQRTAHPDVTFACRLPDGRLRVICDRHQVERALINLLQNAVESIHGRDSGGAAGLPPGRIEISVVDEKTRVVVEIADNGCGLPAEARERLTEPYVTTRAKGTGLGLAIVKKILEDHGGDLQLGDREGGGARVRLVFPVGRAGGDDRPAAPAEAPATTERALDGA
jgi:two-component system, NtrC family, nitrogen regulation sensor histidine kinase NtrY